MSSDSQHIYQAQKNVDFLESFIDQYKFNDWAITVAFYVCVHIVEAVIFLKKDLKHQGYSIRIENSEDLPAVATAAKIPPPKNLSWTAKLNHAFRNLLLAENFPEISEKYNYLYSKSKSARYYCYKWDSKDVDLTLKYSLAFIVSWFNKTFSNSLKISKPILK